MAIFLDKLMEATGGGVVHIVAHSMGAEVLGEAFKNMSTRNLVVTGSDKKPIPKFNQIVLAAADIDSRDFEKLILPAIESGHRVTSYVSYNDKALRLSRKGNADPRAGDSGASLVLLKGVETIDASAVNSEYLGHSFFAQSPRMIVDMKTLLQLGAQPGMRGYSQYDARN